jgi:hypothetical protein
MSDQATRNLVIVHSPDHQALSDWTTVKEKIEARAPDIEVRIADNTIPNSATRRWQVRRPSLVFSASPLLAYRPAGGRVYQGQRLHKVEPLERLSAAGIPTPDSALLMPGIELDPDRWGAFVVVKPTGRRSSYGRMVQLARTETIGKRYDELTGGGRTEMMVQTYVDATDEEGRGCDVRVMTLFGRPIYSLKATEVSPRPPPAEIADGDGQVALNRKGNKVTLTLEAEDDMIALARATAAAMPEIPCLGIDVLRDRASGRPVMLEANGASVWHLSSRSTRNYPPEVQKDIYTQFDALETAAEALIERTRGEAR